MASNISNSYASSHAPAALLVLKASGIRLDRDGNRFVQEHFSTFAGSVEDARKLAQNIVDRLISSGKHRQSVSKAVLQEVLATLIQQESGTDATELTVIDPFEMNCYTYNREKRRIMTSSVNNKENIESNKKQSDAVDSSAASTPDFTPMYLDAHSKPRVFETRYALVHLKLLHYYKMRTRNAVTILTVDDLRTAARGKSVVVFGMLVNRERKFFLEDPSAVVEMIGITDDKQCQHRKGIYFDGCFILVEGVKRENDNLLVENICLPPVENAETLRSYFGNTDFFLGQPNDSKLTPKTNRRVLQIQAEYRSQWMLVMNDVILDDSNCMAKLRSLLKKHLQSDSLPFCLIFMGKFHRDAVSQTGYATGVYTSSITQLKRGFAELGLAFAAYADTIARNKIKIVFVPDLEEVGMSSVLPRPPLPRVLIEIFSTYSKIPFNNKKEDSLIANACNPCRLRYFAQDIIVVADQLLKKMCQNAIRMPQLENELESDFARTLLSQSHLAPFMPHVTATYWGFDHALRLITSPDAVIFGDDQFKQFSTQHQQCVIANAGVFAVDETGGDQSKQTAAQYMAFYPITKEVQLLNISADDTLNVIAIGVR